MPGERVTVWRVLSRDPDRDEEYDGELVAIEPSQYRVLVDGERSPNSFPKLKPNGVRLWRLTRRPGR